MLLLRIIAWLTVVLRANSDDLASVRVRVTTKGLDYVVKLATKYLESALLSRTIDTFESHLGPNREAHLTLEDVRISSLGSPSIGYKLIPPYEIMWFSSGGNMEVEGSFKLTVNKFVRIDGSGSLKANVTGINFSATGALLSNSMEEPVLNITSCMAQLDHVEISYSGGLIAWALNKFRDTINSRVAQLITKTIVDRVKTVGEHMANHRLGSVPMMIELPMNMFLNYRMAGPVEVTSEYLDFHHRGEVTVGGMRTIGYPPPGLPVSNRSDHMVMVWISQYVFNSFLSSMHDQRILRIVISKERYPHMAKTLRTTCPFHDECIGVAIDKVGMAAPNNSVIVKLKTRAPPKCTIIKGYSGPKVKGQLDGVLSFLNDSGEQILFTFEVNYDISSTVQVKRGRLHASVRIIRLSVDIVDTEIGRISPMELIFIEMAVQDELQKAIGRMLKDGLPIPAFSIMKYDFPEVVMDHGSLLAYSDMFFTPV